MLFIFNALNDGWTVKNYRMINLNLLKKMKNKKEVILEECIKKYIRYNIT